MLLAPLVKHALVHDVDQGMLGRRALETNEIVRSAKLFLDGIRTEVQEGQSKAPLVCRLKHRSNERRKTS